MGELGVDQYLDGRVEQATAHLAASLDPEQLAFIREQLRDQLSSDPVLSKLVQRVTGVTASALAGGSESGGSEP